MDKEKKIGSHVRGSILRSKVNKKKNVNPKIMKGAAFVGGAFAVGGTASQAYKAFAAEENNNEKDLNAASNLDNALDKYAESYANQTPSDSYSEASSISESTSELLSNVSSQAHFASYAKEQDEYLSSLWMQSEFADSMTLPVYFDNPSLAVSGSNSILNGWLSHYSETGSPLYQSESYKGASLSEQNSENFENGVWDSNWDNFEIVGSNIGLMSNAYQSASESESSIQVSQSTSWSVVTSNSLSTSTSDSTVASESDSVSTSDSTVASESDSVSASDSIVASESASVSDSISSSESMASESQAGGGTTNPQTGDSNAALILGAAGLGAAGLAGAMAKKKNEK